MNLFTNLVMNLLNFYINEDCFSCIKNVVLAQFFSKIIYCEAITVVHRRGTENCPPNLTLNHTFQGFSKIYFPQTPTCSTNHYDEIWYGLSSSLTLNLPDAKVIVNSFKKYVVRHAPPPRK